MFFKVVSLILCVSTLMVIAQDPLIDPKDIQKYFDCYNYATCETDGPDHEKSHACLNDVTQQDLDELYQHVLDGVFPFKSKTEPGAVKEYCNFDNDKKKKAYTTIVNAAPSFVSRICGPSGDQGKCKRVSEAWTCLFAVGDELHTAGKC